VELSVQFDQHKTVLVSFSGTGYDPSQLELPDVTDTSLAVATSNSDDVMTANGSRLLTLNQVSIVTASIYSIYHHLCNPIGSNYVTWDGIIWSPPIICHSQQDNIPKE